VLSTGTGVAQSGGTAGSGKPPASQAGSRESSGGQAATGEGGGKSQGKAEQGPTARELAEQGVQAMKENRHADAVKALDASYRKEQNPRVLLNLGLAYEGMGYPSKAQQALKSYVQYAEAKGGAKFLNRAQQELQALETGYARYALKVSPADAKIEIDGEPARATDGELWVPVGEHEVRITATGHEPYEQVLQVTSGRYDLEIQLRQAPDVPPARAATLVDEGMALAAAGDHAAALTKLKLAKEIYPTPRGEAQLGLVYEQLGNLGEAEEHLIAALQEKRDPYVRENRRTLKQAIRRVRRVTGTLNITGSPDGAEIDINGTHVGDLPLGGPIKVAAGKLTITATKDGYQPVEQLVTLPARATRSVLIELPESTIPTVMPVPLQTPEEAAQPVAGAVPALTPEQAKTPGPIETDGPPAQAPPPEEVPPAEQESASQADIEAFSDPREDLADEPEPEGEPATGFESAINFGYTPWIGGPKTQGSSGYFTGQILLGARVAWPISFGLQINGGFDLSAEGTKSVINANPGLYVRGHIQQEKRAVWYDVWGGVGIQPIAMQVALLEPQQLDPSMVDITAVDPADLQRALAAREVGLDAVRTIQSVNVPIELGATFWITEGFGLNLAGALTFWLPTQDCLHDGSDRLCYDSELDSQTSLTVMGGLAFLP
jgi:tetratricopeptide (TPR) repeat protein